MVRCYGLYANAHRGKVRKARPAAVPLRIVRIASHSERVIRLFDGQVVA
jgi:hypothetical protein